MADSDDASRGFRAIDRFDGGVGWLAHPGETLQRASHAVRGDDGVWLLDPVDAPGLDDLLADLGDVAGVAVCSNWHARDAGRVASRFDLPVTVPAWMDRVEERVDAPVERFEGALGRTGFEVICRTPLVKWREAVLWRPADRTLYVPETLGTVDQHTRGDERLGASAYSALAGPPTELAGLDPDRILVGHGEGVFDDAGAALEDALAFTRWRALRLAAANLGSYVREVTGRGAGDDRDAGRSFGC